MTKHYVALSLIFAAIIGIAVWFMRGGAMPVIGTNPAPDVTPQEQADGPKYLTYNTATYNPGPPVQNYILPRTTSGYPGSNMCDTCGTRTGGKF